MPLRLVSSPPALLGGPSRAQGGLGRWASRGCPRQCGELAGGHHGAAYLYPLVRGPKIENKTMLDEPRRERGKTSSPTRSWQVPMERAVGPGGGRCACTGPCRLGGASRPGTLTQLLQLRCHGLGAQRERRGRGTLRGRGSCGQTGETCVRPTLCNAAHPNPPSRTTWAAGGPGAGGVLPGRRTDVGKLAVSAASTRAVMAWDQAGSSDGPGQAPGHTRHPGSLPSWCGSCRGASPVPMTSGD